MAVSRRPADSNSLRSAPGNFKRWRYAQQRILDEFSVSRAVDVHCHCLPGMDDGPDSMEDSIALCEALVDDGITTVIATPHQLGSYERANSAGLIGERAQQLRAKLDALGIPLEVLTGGDVRIDERLPVLLEQGEIEPVAGQGRHLLLELPHSMPVDPIPLIRYLTERGIQSVVTHPERYRYLGFSSELPSAWVREGAVLQITAASLTGEFGRQAYELGWRLVRMGLAGLVATDAHDAFQRPPRFSLALGVLVRELGWEAARRLCLTNPLKLVEGEPIGIYE